MEGGGNRRDLALQFSHLAARPLVPQPGDLDTRASCVTFENLWPSYADRHRGMVEKLLRDQVVPIDVDNALFGVLRARDDLDPIAQLMDRKATESLLSQRQPEMLWRSFLRLALLL